MSGKPREDRRKVLIGARMRRGSAWEDVWIVDIASRGLGLQSPSPPPRGEYVEVRRGIHVIVGRVMWASRHRFGLHARGRLPVHSIVTQPDRPAVTVCPDDGRTLVRVERRAQSSRSAARSVEFAFVAFAGLCAVAAVAMMMHEALSRPMSVIAATLPKE